MSGARPCCDFGRSGLDRDGPLADPAATRVYQEVLQGGVRVSFRLCAQHHAALTRVLLAHGEVCTPAEFRRRREAPVARTVTGDDQRRARTEAGLSQRQLAALTGRSRSLVANAELGAHPVDPTVAAWVVATLGA